jgi:hypothetical protein
MKKMCSSFHTLYSTVNLSLNTYYAKTKKRDKKVSKKNWRMTTRVTSHARSINLKLRFYTNLTTYRFHNIYKHADDFKLLFQSFSAFFVSTSHRLFYPNSREGAWMCYNAHKNKLSSEIGKEQGYFAEPASLNVCGVFFFL